ncbi:hypothetical protein GCM10018962_07490 [Dactylosporangium matsuzakiense]|uniref:Uncharacterized protein n=1 Tax=Dactylosporangium matsuzakiense TaxID=53360 RepID=A0A9W6KD98_9ACTN|nr:hypothetical protein GCM10017581_005020 [Dactylosporangium matsuzakiense]
MPYVRNVRPMHQSAVPPKMIERATERRLAGDWRGACAAAYVTPAVDLGKLRQFHGAEFAESVESDLRHVIPDLLRWYLPRDPSTGRLNPGMRYPLSRIGDSHALYAYTPPLHEPQCVQLRVAPLDNPGRNRDDTLLLLPERWDSRRTTDLLARCGGPDFLTSPPLLLDESGHHAEAWSAAGYDLEVQLFQDRWGRDRVDPAAYTDPDRRRQAVDKALSWLRPAYAYLPTAAQGLAGDPGLVRIDMRGRRLVLDLDSRRVRLLSRVPYHREDDKRRRAEIEAFGAELSKVPPLPLIQARRPSELTALLRSEISPNDLHPLIHQTLFPCRPGPHHPPRSPLRTTIKIRCGTATHTVEMRDNQIVIPHTADEIARERTLIALGGTHIGCLAAVDGWSNPRVPMPRPMQRLRDEITLLAQHGDTWTLDAAISNGLDPNLRNSRGQTLTTLLEWTSQANPS